MILHIISRADWATAQTAGTIVAEPFLHCSSAEQVHLPATALFRGRTDMLLLHIDEDRLPTPVVWEQGDPPDPDGMLFPHLYGPLLTEAVTAAVPYLPEPDGTFHPPPTTPSQYR